MKSKTICGIFVAMLILAGCNDFLSAPPQKKDNLKIDNTESLDELLNYYDIAFDRSREVILATDDYGLYKDYYKANPSNYVLQTDFLQNILWFPERSAAQESNYWDSEYTKISYANTVLSTIDKVKGTEADKTRLKQDAHMIRAYEYFQLATLYCLPYSQENRSALGLPIKQSLSYDESVKRKTLGETMDFIKNELDLALKTSEPRDEKHLWRISLPGAQSFAARYYLYLHDYDQALSYANKALDNYNTLVDYQSYFAPTMQTYSRSGGTYTGPNVPSGFDFDEFLYSRIMYNQAYQAVPSQSLVNLFDQSNDYRYESFIVEDYSLVFAGIPGWSAYWQFGSIGLIDGTTTGEMYLIKAECEARNNNMSAAVNDLNMVRSHRYKSGTYTNLTTGDFKDIAAVVQFIINERRREFPMTLRWYDIKRINSDPANLVDKITIKRNFYVFDGLQVDTTQDETYTLAPGDPRFAWPIPEGEIELSKGKIVQNPYN